VFITISGFGGAATGGSAIARTASIGGAIAVAGFSIEARKSRPAAVICQPVGSRTTKA
jgi:hypothetical protein